MNDIKLGIEQDDKYFRVFLKWGSHKLHSEKLNLETAIDFHTEILKMNGILE